MSKSLVIVESPAKAKTINKYLGPDFVVKSSVGHIRDLPTSGNSKVIDTKARAAAAAVTRKMKPEEKIAYKKKKAKQQLVTRMGIDPDKDVEMVPMKGGSDGRMKAIIAGVIWAGIFKWKNISSLSGITMLSSLPFLFLLVPWIKNESPVWTIFLLFLI